MYEDLTREREMLTRIAKKLSSRNMQTGNGGNISLRLTDHAFLVKATDTSFDRANPSDFVVCDMEGNLLEGEKRASKESGLHGALYKKYTACQAIVHCHSPWATGWASTLKPLPTATYHSVLKLGGNIPCIDTNSYAVPREYYEQIFDLLDKTEGGKGFLLKGHGQVAFGKSLYEALDLAELIEETAHIAVIEQLLKGNY